MVEEKLNKKDTISKADIDNLEWALKFLQNYERKHSGKKRH